MSTPSLSLNSQSERSSLQAWIVCLVGSLFFFYEFMQMNIFNAIDESIGAAFHLNAVQLSKLSSLFFLANVLFIPIAGAVLDRFKTKSVILAMMALCVFGTWTFSATDSTTVLAISRFLTGVGSAFCFVASMQLAAKWFPPQRLGFVTGIIITLAMSGGIIAQTPLTLLVEKFGWRQALGLDALFGLLICGLIFLFVKPHPSDQQSTHIDFKKLIRTIFKCYSQAHNVTTAMYICLMNFPLALFGVIWGMPYLTHTFALSTTQASVVTSLLFFGMIIGSPTFGWISDRLRKRLLPMQVGACFAVFLGLILCASNQFGLNSLCLIFFSLGFAASSQVLGYPTIAEASEPDTTATAVSVGSFATQAGCMLIPSLFAWLLMMFSTTMPNTEHPLAFSPATYQQALLSLPASFIVALALSFFIKDPLHD